MRIRFLAFAAAIFLSACAPPEASLFIACKTFSSTEQAIRPFASQLTNEQIGAVVGAFSIIRPLCTSRVIDMTDPLAAARVVKAQLSRLKVVEAEVVK